MVRLGVVLSTIAMLSVIPKLQQAVK